MQEYISEAVVLHKETVREHDARYSIFTKRFGKVVGKATSTRKITSKLAGHLEPGTLSRVRFVEKGGTQVVDALKGGVVAAAFPDLRLLNGLLHEGEPDRALWEALTQDVFSWRSVLRILGWDPEGAACEHCAKRATHFYIPRQEFFCVSCASKMRPNELILLDDAKV